ncbi:telomere repeat-binding factor 1-like protein [Tanacetum coccineum]|uniref:MYB transcription factor n=1 Tax=Tanacetum coccineum TaxID=301880 RepID=A0ABQ5B4N5_9ASTR
MGAPKKKWSSEEEAALNAGIAKYGLSKWTTILRDVEFAKVLEKRSGVDLKDKWRNMSLIASGRSRTRARPKQSEMLTIYEPEDLSSPRKERDLIDCMLDFPAILPAASQIGSSKMPIPMPRLDILILDAIVDLKEKRGSSRAAISEYLQEKHSVPPNFMKLLQAELKSLMNCGKLIKVKHRYRIGPSSSCLRPKRSPSPLPLEVKQGCFSNGETSAIRILTKEEKDAELEKMWSMTPQQAAAIAMEVVAEPETTIKVLTKAGIDAELEKMRSMTPQQAAAMAMKAVAEAEASILEAERAEKAAEAAEADAERAKVFADAAMGIKTAYPFYMTMATRSFSLWIW